MSQSTAHLDPRTPVLVGVGSIVQRSPGDPSLDAIGLMIEAARAAVGDAGGRDLLGGRTEVAVPQFGRTGERLRLRTGR